MAENDKKPHYPRRNNPPQRPLPGVQKAINNFGVADLRQLLDKKHKEQEESQGEKPIDPKKIPPPDPSYNYLRDPARDKPRAPQPQGRGDNRKPHTSRPKNYENSNDTEETANENPKTANFRGRYPRRGNSNFSRDNPTTLEDNANELISGNFRGRSPRRGRGKPRNKDHPDTIIDLLNIKIEFSSETGQRSCVLDEDTKIADIKHVPDHPIRGSPRRGSFRGRRGRGRGYYRGRGGFFNNRNTDNDVVPENNEETQTQGNENELSSEYHDDSEEQATNTFDSNLAETITVESSKFEDGDVKRLVEVKLLEKDENNTSE